MSRFLLFLFFAHEHPVVPGPFIEPTILSVLLRLLQLILLSIIGSVFMKVPHALEENADTMLLVEYLIDVI